MQQSYLSDLVREVDRATWELLVQAPLDPLNSLRATWQPLSNTSQAPGGDVETPLHLCH